MRKIASSFLAVIVWFAVIAQYIVFIHSNSLPLFQNTERFLSFFTILTNITVAIYFTLQFFSVGKTTINKPGVLTAITVYITVVGLIYQLLLRHLWQPTGMQKIADELLHSINPILVIIFWYMYEDVQQIKYQQIIGWLLYPLIYLAFILVRGHFTLQYPYPFVNVVSLGYQAVIINAFFLAILFAGLSALYIFMGKKLKQ